MRILEDYIDRLNGHDIISDEDAIDAESAPWSPRTDLYQNMIQIAFITAHYEVAAEHAKETAAYLHHLAELCTVEHDEVFICSGDYYYEQHPDKGIVYYKDEAMNGNTAVVVNSDIFVRMQFNPSDQWKQTMNFIRMLYKQKENFGFVLINCFQRVQGKFVRSTADFSSMMKVLDDGNNRLMNRDLAYTALRCFYYTIDGFGLPHGTTYIDREEFNEWVEARYHQNMKAIEQSHINEDAFDRIQTVDVEETDDDTEYDTPLSWDEFDPRWECFFQYKMSTNNFKTDKKIFQNLRAKLLRVLDQVPVEHDEMCLCCDSQDINYKENPQWLWVNDVYMLDENNQNVVGEKVKKYQLQLRIRYNIPEDFRVMCQFIYILLEMQPKQKGIHWSNNRKFKYARVATECLYGFCSLKLPELHKLWTREGEIGEGQDDIGIEIGDMEVTRYREAFSNFYTDWYDKQHGNGDFFKHDCFVSDDEIVEFAIQRTKVNNQYWRNYWKAHPEQQNESVEITMGQILLEDYLDRVKADDVEDDDIGEIKANDTPEWMIEPMQFDYMIIVNAQIWPRLLATQWVRLQHSKEFSKIKNLFNNYFDDDCKVGLLTNNHKISEKLGVEFKEQLLETSNTMLKDNLQLMIQFNIGDQYRMFVRLMRNLMLILDKAQVYQKERTQLFIYNFEYMREHGGQFDRHFGAYNVKNIVEKIEYPEHWLTYFEQMWYNFKYPYHTEDEIKRKFGLEFLKVKMEWNEFYNKKEALN